MNNLVKKWNLLPNQAAPIINSLYFDDLIKSLKLHLDGIDQTKIIMEYLEDGVKDYLDLEDNSLEDLIINLKMKSEEIRR